MKTINVTVRDKIASAAGDIVYICGNSDYVINFDFDAEWDAHDVKTARFVYDGSYIDVVFTGNQCAIPVIHKAYGIYVGVYAGDLRTTTAAHIPSVPSILSADGTPAEPPDDVYAQITALCNKAVSEAKSVREDADAGRFDGAPGKTPVVGEDYFTEEDKKEIASEAAEAVGFPQPTSADDGKMLRVVDGKAKWEGALLGYTDDLTPTQVYEAVKAGRPVVVTLFSDLYGVLTYTSFAVAELFEVIASNVIVYFQDGYVLAELIGSRNTDTWDFFATGLAEKGDIPSTLPNPNPLTIKAGDTNVTYNGSTEETVDVVEAVGFPKPTKLDNGKFLGCENGKAAWLPVEASGGGDISLGLTSASVGQTIKVKAVDENGKPTEWEAEDLSAEPSFPKFEKILSHTITEEEAKAAPHAFTWGTDIIPNLNDFNVFTLTIRSPDESKITFTKWVRIKINNVMLGNITGGSAGARGNYTVSANRLYGFWVSDSIYNQSTDAGKTLSHPYSSMSYTSSLADSVEVTSIGFASYSGISELTAGIIVEIWGAK